MGLIKDVHCNNCGKHWKHYEGGGFQCEIYYCNKCGKEVDYQIFDSCPELWEQRRLFRDKWESEEGIKEKKSLEKHLISIDKQIKKHKFQTIGICNCGGKYELNGNIIICPDCHSQDITDNGYWGFWD